MSKTIIKDPFLNEYVFDCIVNSTIQQRKNLTGYLLKFTKNKTTARLFADDASFEMKLIMLARLGKSFKIIFESDEGFQVKRLKDIYHDYKLASRVATANEMLGRSTFVVSDKDVHVFLGILAQNCHSETYMMNRDYLRAGYVATQWEGAELPNSSEIHSSIEATKFVVRMILNASMSLDYVDGLTGVDDKMMRIMLYLYPYRNSYKSYKEILEYFKGTLRPKEIRLSLNGLKKILYIQQMTREKSYTLTGIGVQNTLMFAQRILSSSF
jgi:hypothetical protein